jgi:inner membrane protein
VEPATHALTSVALAGAVQHRLPRFGMAMLVVSGVAADLDYLSYFGGAGAFLKFHRAVLHSLLGSALLVLSLAATFCWADRKFPQKQLSAPLPFIAASAFCCLGAAWHLVLDFSSGEAVQLFWPFHMDSSAWNFVANFDPWILWVLLLGLLLPQLFRLVSDEIGERSPVRRGQRGAAIALGLVVLYIGARGVLHYAAETVLRSRDYHGRAPVIVGTFPGAVSPLAWRGVVDSAATIEEVPVSLAPGVEFDPEGSVTHLKPEESPVLDAGQTSESAKLFLRYARFPLATVYPLENGTRFELRDLQFPSGDTSLANILVRVDFDSNLRIRREQLLFASARRN